MPWVPSGSQPYQLTDGTDSMLPSGKMHDKVRFFGSFKHPFPPTTKRKRERRIRLPLHRGLGEASLHVSDFLFVIGAHGNLQRSSFRRRMDRRRWHPCRAVNRGKVFKNCCLSLQGLRQGGYARDEPGEDYSVVLSSASLITWKRPKRSARVF